METAQSFFSVSTNNLLGVIKTLPSIFGLKQNLLKCSLADIGSMIEIKKASNVSKKIQ